MSVAIKIEHLSKQYRLGLVSTKTLSHDLNRWWTMNIQGKDDPYLKIGEGAREQRSEGKRSFVSSRLGVENNNDYIWALRDINLEVEQGEILGIIGKNAAGKSTLLKILSKVTAPTIGTIKANGRIASLLEVGTGFHPEMTGRENIFMNGSIMGMSKAEITQKLDKIIDFAGLEKFIDTPVKRYSSGMTVRLGFAVAAHLEPEILVVDEVLAVGDAEFQKKAVGEMQSISKKQGRTVLFVSHNMTLVENLCTRLCVLGNGLISYDGEIDDGIKYYLSKTVESKDYIAQSDEFLYCDDDFTLISVEVRQNELTDNFSTKYPIDIKFVYEIKKSLTGLRIGFELINEDKELIIFRSFHDENAEDILQTKPGLYKTKAQIPGCF
jgi:lipopolysaccharide transport system ATP-binding protein